MIGRLVARCRMVAPPAWAVVGALLIFGLFGVPQFVFGLPPADPANPPARRCLVVLSIVLGVYRVVAFHPYFRFNYLRWLKATPWTVRKPLPLGPIELVPEDGLWIGLIMLLGTSQPDPRSIELLDIFLISHTAVLAATFWRTKAPEFGYTAAMLFGFIPLCLVRPWLILAIITGIYLVVHEGLWRALRRFPWKTDGILFDLEFMSQPADHSLSCGWFFDRFHRDIRRTRGISRIDAILCCLLGSWWLFVVSSAIADPNDRRVFLASCLTFVVIGAPLGRLAIYARGYRSPIGILGRVLTLRWVIPGYDQIFIGPVCCLIVGFAAVFFLRSAGTTEEIRLAIGAGLTVLVALTSPPRLRRWRLTGRHRLGPTFSEAYEGTVNKMGQQ